MKKKLIALIVLAVMAFSAISAFASYPDTLDSSWDWARGAIDSMVEQGIIKGYSDNTFRPGNAITKGEAMVLFSRVAGYSAEGNEVYIEKAKEAYASIMEPLKTPYKGEISYLIYKGILSDKTFLTYASDGVVNTPIKRYEAAEFLAKLATNNATLTGSVSSLSFSDIAEINSTMAPYIKYVSENGIMLGMGDGSFAPNGTVTRAQMTVMLSRIIPILSYEYFDGSVKFYNASTNSIIVTLNNGEQQEYDIADNIPVKLDGKTVSPATLLTGSKIRITVSNDNVVAIETISPDYDAVINGKYLKLEKIDNETNGVSVQDSSTGLTTTYALSKTVSVKKDDKKITAADLTQGDYIVLTIKEGYVTSIVAESKLQTFKGKVVDIQLLPTYKMTVLTGGKNVAFELSSSVSVTRNGKKVTVENILVGDEVEIETTYGVITEIISKSKTGTAEGTITQVIISVTPSITVTDSSNNSYTYAVTKNAKITKSDSSVTFYNLRVGDKVKLSIDAQTVTAIDVIAAFANGVEEGENTNISGVIEYFNSAYGYIKLVDSSELVFISKATITDQSGKALTTKALAAGTSITVFGNAKTGSYVASMVVVQK
ncbi:MAG: S-layer homology domain-containing protein [Clostridia bacterium]|nr:S-layer homology domain-containing protein [Clostridia bacterium]